MKNHICYTASPSFHASVNRLSVHLSIRPSVRPPIRIRQSILSVHLSHHLSIRPTMPSMRCVRPNTHSFIRPTIYPSISIYIYLASHPSRVIYSSIHIFLIYLFDTLFQQLWTQSKGTQSNRNDHRWSL